MNPLPLDIEIEYLNAGELVPYSGNSMKHPEAQVLQVMASIREFGFVNPILIRGDKTIIAGHCRFEAGTRLNMTRFPCVRLAHLTPAQARALVIADNKLARGGEFDAETLKNELAQLKDEDFDLGLTGFDFAEIDKMLAADDADENFQGDADDSSGGDSAAVLRWGKTKMDLTEAEATALTLRYNQHVESFGSSYGFISRLLRV